MAAALKRFYTRISSFGVQSAVKAVLPRRAQEIQITPSPQKSNSSMDQKRFTNLELVARVDSWPYYAREPERYKQVMSDFYYFMVEGYNAPFGYAHKTFVNAMLWPESWTIDHEKRLLTLNSPGGFTERTRAMEATLRKENDRGMVPEVRRWDNELFPVYAPDGEHVLDMNGCGVDAFGIVSYAVHTLGYVETTEGRRYWVDLSIKSTPSVKERSLFIEKRIHFPLKAVRG